MNFKQFFCNHHGGFDYVSKKVAPKGFVHKRVEVTWMCDDCGKTRKTIEQKPENYDIDFDLAKLG